MQAFNTLTKQGKMRRYHKMAHFALQSYPLTVNKIRCLSIRHNIIFRVDANEGTFMLRIGYPNIRTALMVNSEMRWLDNMSKITDLKLSSPIRTKDHKLMLTCELEGIPQERHIVVMTWIKGRTVATNVTAEKIQQAGIALAKLHNFSVTYRPKKPFMTYDEFRCGEWGGLSYLDDNEVILDEQKVIFQEAIHESEDALKYWRERDGISLIHADFHFKNMNWYRGNVYLFDFDDFRWGHFLQDLGITLQAINELQDKHQLREIFLHAYQSQRPIPYSEQDLRLAQVHRMMTGLTFVMNYRSSNIAKITADIVFKKLKKML